MFHRIARILKEFVANRRPPFGAVLVVGGAFCCEMAASSASDPKSVGQAFGPVAATPAEGSAAGQPGAAGAEKPPRPPADLAGQDGVLALIDGRVIAGKVMAAPGGYMLKRSGSSDEMVPAFLVHTASDSLTGCYENLRDAVRSPRPDDHLKLADWCIRQKLLDEARTEVVAALKLDPNRREARELLTRIEEFMSPQLRHLQTEAAPLRTSDGFLESSGRTTEGISQESTSLFVRRIQPLLVSKCGNAACHGGSDSGEFQLANVRRTSSSGRMTTLENLREVLSFVDSDEPVGTRLLSALESPAHAVVFKGTAGATQQTAIQNWVQSAATDLGLREETPRLATGSPVWTREAIALVSGDSSQPAAQGRVAARTGPDRPGTKGATRSPLQRAVRAPILRKVIDEEALAEKVLNEERPDPFAPEEFNRMVNARFSGVPQNQR